MREATALGLFLAAYGVGNNYVRSHDDIRRARIATRAQTPARPWIVRHARRVEHVLERSAISGLQPGGLGHVFPAQGARAGLYIEIAIDSARADVHNARAQSSLALFAAPVS